MTKGCLNVDKHYRIVVPWNLHAIQGGLQSAATIQLCALGYRCIYKSYPLAIDTFVL